MGLATGFMPKVSTEQRMWDNFVLSLEHIVNNANVNRTELSVDVAERFLEIMDEIEQGMIDSEFIFYGSSDDHTNEVYSVLRKHVIPRYLSQYRKENPLTCKESPKHIHKIVAWNLMQDIKRPFKKIVNGEHIFREEVKEFTDFLDYAKRHYVSYSMERID